MACRRHGILRSTKEAGLGAAKSQPKTIKEIAFPYLFLETSGDDTSVLSTTITWLGSSDSVPYLALTAGHAVYDATCSPALPQMTS